MLIVGFVLRFVHMARSEGHRHERARFVAFPAHRTVLRAML